MVAFREKGTLSVPEYVPRSGEGAAVEDEVILERPRRYRVLLHNDNFTTMDFVILILERIFRRPHGKAIEIMLNVHENGMGVAGVYVKAVAETKIDTVHALAAKSEFPLKCSMEPE